MTWRYMLGNLKRISKNLNEAAKNPDYYLGRMGADVTFIDIDGQLFISSGKHRSTIAKYLAYYNPHKFVDGPVINGVDVIKYEVNHALMNQVEALRSKLATDDFNHVMLRWIGSSSPFNKDRFQVSNNLRLESRPLFFYESNIHELFEMLNSSRSMIHALKSEHINYLRRPLKKLLRWPTKIT